MKTKIVIYVLANVLLMKRKKCQKN